MRLASLLLILLPTAALAMDPRLPVLTEEADAQAKLAAFARAHGDDPAVGAALAAAEALPARDRIHRALQARPDYALATERYATRPDDPTPWRLLAESPDRFVRAHATYFLGRALLAQDDLEGAAQAFEAVRGRLRDGTPYTDEATLYLAYVYARIPELKGDAGGGDRTRARLLLESLLPGEALRYPAAPERLVEGAEWLRRELRGDGMGPLLELAKRMETIARLLRRARTGESTQERQEQVIVAIDRLIELMREKQNQGGGQGEGGQGQKGQQQQQQQQQGGPPQGQKGGAKESKLPQGGQGETDLAEGPRAADLEAWGEMADREREEALQFLRERFPAKYREVIERYYRALAEQDR